MNDQQRASVVTATRDIKGWLAPEEACLLASLVEESFYNFGKSLTLVEIGSYCGKSTIALGLGAKIFATDSKIYAIDPHVGDVGGQILSPTWHRFAQNIAEAKVDGFIVPMMMESSQAKVDGQIHLLFIDGKHDYANVSNDFKLFEQAIVQGGLVAFHDYASQFPDVIRFADEVIVDGRYVKHAQAASLIVLRKVHVDA